MLLIAFECCFLSLLKNVLCLSAAYNALYIECIGRLFPSNWTRVVCLINLCSSALLNFFQTMSHTNNQCLCPFFFHIRCFPKIPDLARKRLILPQACYYPSINSKCYSFSPSKRCFIKWYFPFFWKLLILFNLSKDVRRISSSSKWTRPLTKLRSSADLKLSIVISFPKDVTRLLTDDYC